MAAETPPPDYAHRTTLRVGDADVVVYSFLDSTVPGGPRSTWLRWDDRALSLVIRGPHAVMRELGLALVAAAEAANGRDGGAR